MNRETTERHAARAEANADIDTIESMLAANRAALDKTLSELEERVSMEGLVQVAMDRLRGDSGAEFLRSLRDSALDNPLPITLAAVGLAWTACSQSNNGRAAGLSAGGLSKMRRKTASAASRASEEAAERLRMAKAQGREWRERGGEAVDDVRERVSEVGRDAAEWTRRSIEQAHGLASEYPMIVAGAGLALGAALAAVLPATRIENERLGPARDWTVRRAREAGAAAREGAEEGLQGGASGAKGVQVQAEGVSSPHGANSHGSNAGFQHNVTGSHFIK
ncbi:hypothetical protein [Nitrococcus mobilis]|uniref:DUF3618 domain-containing protein n=1 Tax=Nitrococcus mobilis Nb-231 TaxID=314278 RepID=A4BTD9_9GAMM|nr:hypothetical protein [Nitrococcus mobilis]EAR21041.1 hypothetical protein NB231_07722 [Nitrococcus mobilis Nb-231]